MAHFPSGPTSAWLGLLGWQRGQPRSADDEDFLQCGGLGEAGQFALVEDFVSFAAAQKLGVEARHDGGHHEAVAHETAQEVKAGEAVGLAEDGKAVWGYVVGAGPLTKDADLRQDGHDLHEGGGHFL